jgi:hypothetical protein
MKTSVGLLVFNPLLLPYLSVDEPCVLFIDSYLHEITIVVVFIAWDVMILMRANSLQGPRKDQNH